MRHYDHIVVVSCRGGGDRVVRGWLPLVTPRLNRTTNKRVSYSGRFPHNPGTPEKEAARRRIPLVHKSIEACLPNLASLATGKKGVLVQYKSFTAEGRAAVDSVFAALADAIALSYGRMFWCRREHEDSGLRTLGHRVISLMKTRGLIDLVKSVKSLLNWCRGSAMKGEVLPETGLAIKASSILTGGFSLSCFRGRGLVRVLFQLSRAGRALPVPPPEVAWRTMRDHRRNLTMEFHCWDTDLKDFRTYCRNSTRQVNKAAEIGGAFSLVRKSSFETPRSLGGQFGELKTKVNHFRTTKIPRSQAMELVGYTPPDLLAPYILYNGDTLPELVEPQASFLLFSPEYEMDKEVWTVVREWLFAVWSAYLSVDWNSRPRCRQLAVLERGFKARVVTSQDACDIFLAAPWNGILLEILRGSVVHRCGLRGSPIGNLPTEWERRTSKEQRLRSLDLKTATDLLPHDLVHEGILGLCEGLGVEGVWKQILMRLAGPFDMTVGSGRVYTTRRGLLMGSPIAWPILSLYVSWVATKAYRDEGITDGRWMSVVGDDLLCRTTWDGSERMNRIISRTGGTLSTGKDYFGENGVLCEEAFDGSLKWIPTLSIRVVQGCDRSGTPAWAQGPSISEALARLPPSLQLTASRIYRLRMSTALQMLRRAGISPYVPRSCGGAGFPSKPKAPLAGMEARMVRGILSQGPEVGITIRTRFHSAWTSLPRHGLVQDLVEEDLDTYFGEIGRRLAASGDVESVKESELAAQFLAAHTARYLYLDWPAEPAALQLGIVAGHIKKVRKMVLERIYWVPEAVVNEPSIAYARISEWDRLSCPAPVFKRSRFKLVLDEGVVPYGIRLC